MAMQQALPGISDSKYSMSDIFMLDKESENLISFINGMLLLINSISESTSSRPSAAMEASEAFCLRFYPALVHTALPFST